jgi:hypothetical protein
LAAFWKLSEGGSRLRSMGMGRRVRAARSGLPARRVACGCSSFGRIAYPAVVSDVRACVVRGSGAAHLGASRRRTGVRLYGECGAEAAGHSVIVEVLDSHGLSWVPRTEQAPPLTGRGDVQRDGVCPARDCGVSLERKVTRSTYACKVGRPGGPMTPSWSMVGRFSRVAQCSASRPSSTRNQ